MTQNLPRSLPLLKAAAPSAGRRRKAQLPAERPAHLDGEDGPGPRQSTTHLLSAHLHQANYLPVLQEAAEGPLPPGPAVQR